MALYTLAPIDNSEDAKIFFETYNIPYQVIVRGENKGKLRVKTSRSVEDDAVPVAKRRMERAGYGVLCDHSNVFRDADDRPVITFSPCHIGIDNIEVPGYEVEISDLSLYSDGARTIVMRQK